MSTVTRAASNQFRRHLSQFLTIIQRLFISVMISIFTAGLPNDFPSLHTPKQKQHTWNIREINANARKSSSGIKTEYSGAHFRNKCLTNVSASWLSPHCVRNMWSLMTWWFSGGGTKNYYITLTKIKILGKNSTQKKAAEKSLFRVYFWKIQHQKK